MESKKTIIEIYKEEIEQTLRLVEHLNKYSGQTTLALTDNIYSEFDAYLHWQRKSGIYNYVIEVKNREIECLKYDSFLIEEKKYTSLKTRPQTKLYICFVNNQVWIYNLDKNHNEIEKLETCERWLPKSKLDQTKIKKKVRYLPKEWAQSFAI